MQVAGHSFGGNSRDHCGRNSSSCCSEESQGLLSLFLCRTSVYVHGIWECPRPSTECVAITQDTGDILRKLIVSYSLFSRFCFWKDRLTGGPGRGFCFQPTFRVQPPLVGRATPQSHQVSGAESCGTTPPLCGNCPSRSFPCGLTFMHVYYWVSRLHVGSYTVIFILGS